MLQRLLTALAQVKTGNMSENSINEIFQIIQSLYWAKRITKKLHNKKLDVDSPRRNLTIYQKQYNKLIQ